MKIEISDRLRRLIQDKGTELSSGKVTFPTQLVNMFRAETAEYNKDRVIIEQMIAIYNEEGYRKGGTIND